MPTQGRGHGTRRTNEMSKFDLLYTIQKNGRKEASCPYGLLSNGLKGELETVCSKKGIVHGYSKECNRDGGTVLPLP